MVSPAHGHLQSAGPPHRPAHVLAAAARAVDLVARQGRSADEALARTACDEGAAQSAVRAVTLGTVRWYLRLQPMAAALLAGRALAPTLHALLLVSLHQLEFSHGRPEVTVSSAVDAARLLGQPRAAGLMNALLRRYGREGEALRSRVLADPVAASAHPEWLVALLRTSWPSDWMQIVEANNGPPPMTLRVDLARGSLDDYSAELSDHGAGARAVPGIPGALVLERPMAVGDLPGFREGRVSVQDAGAQLAPALLQVPANARVLDACAAPGGKTGALLEANAGHIELTAVDIDGTRLARVEDNLERLGRRGQANLIQADLTREPAWWDRQPFDRILLDAVCSSVGVIRRHPDIKLLRRATDIDAMAEVQRRMLAQCLSMLRPGGRLLYSTCSVLPAENDAVIEAVLKGLPSARVLQLVEYSAELAASIRRGNYGIQLLPGNAAGTDGFYYACVTVT